MARRCAGGLAREALASGSGWGVSGRLTVALMVQPSWWCCNRFGLVFWPVMEVLAARGLSMASGEQCIVSRLGG